ncbi:MAG: hypothetical protein KDE19_15075, partial [Caldilineaceae bacterium]|nr:hypothetical protein [Caldilineaceae bacterium]
MMNAKQTKPIAKARQIPFSYLLIDHRWLVALFLACMMWWASTLVAVAAPVAQDTTCDEPLPTIEWLGEGAGTYVLGDNFDTFIVKRKPPFRFVTEPGTVNGQGETVYQATGNERVWRCAGNCGLPAEYHDAFTLGNLDVGTTVNLVVIDDDIDDRHNWWAVNDPMTPYLTVDEQNLVEYLSFDIPVAGTWYYYAQDSIGIA